MLMEDLLPSTIVDSTGKTEEFSIDKLFASLKSRAGLTDEAATNACRNVLRKITLVGADTLTSMYVRELVSMELLNGHGSNLAHTNYMTSFNKRTTKFKLDDDFISGLIGKQPNWGPIGYFTYKRTYARTLDDGSTEEFWQTIKRVVEGCFSIQKHHCLNLGLPWKESKAQKSAQIMFTKMWEFKFLAPGRGLWMMGTPFIDKHGSMALNNCGFVSTGDIDIKGANAFEWTMDALMLGVGVGFDTKGASKITIVEPLNTTEVHQIQDSREGWVQSLGILLRAYFTGSKLPSFDYSMIRKKGEPIKGFGGVASGPGPLREMHENINQLLIMRIGEPLMSTNIVDIFNFIGKCVVAGNVRRSAEIAIGTVDDADYINMKQDPSLVESHRWVSNNSVYASVGMNYEAIVSKITNNGEPGLVWLDNVKAFSRMCDPPDWKDKKAMGVNPCGEQTLESFELCCLVETFPVNHEDYDEFKETLKYAYLYAKSVTLLNTHWTATNAIMGKNRRIGTSQSGIIDAFVKHGRRNIINWCKQGYDYLHKLDEIYSNWLCVPRSIKITSVKPSGTVSLLPGVSPGIHYPHSKYYIRRVRISDNSPLVTSLLSSGLTIVDDVYSPGTKVIEFPVKEKYFSRGKDDVTIWEQLINAIDYQKHWADNQVSITVTFKQNERQDLKTALEAVEDKLKGVTFLPLEEHGYELPPYEKITKDEYKERISKTNAIDMGNSIASGTRFCDGDKCELM